MDQETKNRLKNSIWGTLVADAAAVGLHWLYDQKRISDVVPETPEFHTPNKEDYEGVSGFYAHGQKSPGDFSQYGEQLMVMLRSLAENKGQYSKAHYEELFRQHFGYGGEYVGYIDHPTRDTLDSIARAEYEEQKDNNEFHGADDVQLPAISKLPALVATYSGNPLLNEVVGSAVRVTNNNDFAVQCGQATATVIDAVIRGRDIDSALVASKKNTSPEISKLIDNALLLKDQDNLSATEEFGLSCNLIFGVPSAVHNMVTSKSYVEAIRNNIYAGGDSCGRAILLGAVVGAANGVGGEKGIPQDWIEKLTQKTEIEALLQTLFG